MPLDDQTPPAVGDEALDVLTYRQAVRQVQAAFAAYRVAGVSVVDELLRDRRAEAEREEKSSSP